MRMINLGCGPNGITGWENLDWGVLPFLSKFELLRKVFVKLRLFPNSYDLKWPSIKLHDIRKTLPYKSRSVDYVYCSHVLEHFEKWEAESILLEMKRVMKKGGLIRIVLPDLKLMVENYKNADDFCKEFFGFDKDKKWGMSGKFIRGHQWMYDKESLKELLLLLGFRKVIFREYGVGKCKDIKKLDYLPHKKISMYVEVQ